MEYNLWPLVGAILLLCTPPYLFFTSRIRRRVTESHASGGFPVPGIFIAWQNWLDLARGYGGAFLLYHHTFALDRETDTYFQELGAIAGVFAVALMLNTYYSRRHLYCLAPVFLLSGISLVLFEWWMVLYSIVAGIMFGRIINSAEAFLIVMAVVIGAFAYFFSSITYVLLMNCFLILLPIVYAFTAKRGLVMAADSAHITE